MSGSRTEEEGVPLLLEDVPVTMPELPPRRSITTIEQFKAIADPTRSRILGIIQNQPSTAKQIADRLGASPGAIGHHLQVLEAAGLARVAARRLTRGIVAKYYTRTARIFDYELPAEIAGVVSPSLDIMSHAHRELEETLEEALADGGAGAMDAISTSSFPHARLTPERAQHYVARLNALVEDLLDEPQDPAGDVYGLATALFRSPKYMQSASLPPVGEDDTTDGIKDDLEDGGE